MNVNKSIIYHNRDQLADEYYTPYYAVDPLLEFIPKDKIIWCPFDDEWSAYFQTFKQNDYHVIRSSIVNDQNFFDYEPKQWDIMISNPPFSIKDDILERAYKLDKPFALLFPINTIQSKKRFLIFNNEIQLLCFDTRIDYHNINNMQYTIKGTPFSSAYFCRNFLPTKLEMRKLYKYEKILK